MAKSIYDKKSSKERVPEFFMPAMPPLELIDWFEKKAKMLLAAVKHRKLNKKQPPANLNG